MALTTSLSAFRQNTPSQGPVFTATIKIEPFAFYYINATRWPWRRLMQGPEEFSRRLQKSQVKFF
jgi:hypothetical protein